MKNKILLPLSLVLIGMLQACGGGGNNSGFGIPAALPNADRSASDKEPATPASADSGSVSAPFERGATARYQLLGPGSQSFGVLSDSEQSANGAMTKLNSNVLSGNSATKEIAGDANFALGRWAAGTVTRSSGVETLTGTDSRAYHYVAINVLTALPTTGTPTCDAGVFTAPTYIAGSGAQGAGTASGSASLAFDSNGAAVGGTLTVTADGVSTTVSLNSNLATPTSTPITGAFLSAGTGAAIQLGASGTDAYVLAVGYAATLPSGARYQGVAKFRCA